MKYCHVHSMIAHHLINYMESIPYQFSPFKEIPWIQESKVSSLKINDNFFIRLATLTTLHYHVCNPYPVKPFSLSPNETLPSVTQWNPSLCHSLLLASPPPPLPHLPDITKQMGMSFVQIVGPDWSIWHKCDCCPLPFPLMVQSLTSDHW